MGVFTGQMLFLPVTSGTKTLMEIDLNRGKSPTHAILCSCTARARLQEGATTLKNIETLLFDKYCDIT